MMENTSRTGPASSPSGSENEHPQRDLKENAPENAAENVQEKVPQDVAEDRDSVTSDSEEASTPSDQNEQEQGDTKNGEGAVDGKGQGDGAAESVLAGIVDAEGNVVDGEGNVVGKVTRDVPEGSMVDTEGDALDTEGNIIGSAQPIDDALKEGRENASESATGVENSTEQPTSETPGGVEAKPDAGEEGVELEDDVDKAAAQGDEECRNDCKGDQAQLDFSILQGMKVNKLGKVVNEEGIPIGQIVEGDVKKLAGKKVDEEGNVWNDSGKIIGRAEPLAAAEHEEEPEAPFEDFPDAVVDAKGNVMSEGRVIGKLVEGDAKSLKGKQVDADGDVCDKNGNTLGKAERWTEPEAEEVEEAEVDCSMLKGMKVNKAGKVVDERGIPIGQIVEGDFKKLVGKKVDEEGHIWNDNGKIIGRAEPLAVAEHEEEPEAPFEDFPNAVVDAKGNVMFEGRIIGKLVEGDAKSLEGKQVDADGDVCDKNGNTLGKAERWTEPEAEEVEEAEVDCSVLKGMKVNKAGKVVDERGIPIGQIVEGDFKKLVGKKVDEEGHIWNDNGKIIGRAEPLADAENEVAPSAPFEDFPDAVLDAKGNVLFEGRVVGKLVEGDCKKLEAKKVDADGDITDKNGNTLGKAERWTEPAESEPEVVDLSELAGKKVNKLGNIVDSSGQIFGRVIEGDTKKLVGKMCDKNGNVMNGMGQVIGKAELVPESEREGEKTGPFADFDSPKISKDGKVVDATGTIIGQLIEGDAKKLSGKLVDPDGDVLDNNGNSIGKAERWEEEEKEVTTHPAAGRKANREGNVVDENGDVIAKLTEGEVTKCAGKEIDNDGDIINQKGQVVGHVTLLEHIPAPPEEEPKEPEESEEEMEKRKQAEQDSKLASQMATCIEQSIDKLKPILKLITDTIDAAERQPEEERDEKKLVDTVKPLLEEGGGILQECNGAVRALDPDGRIQTNAKHKAASREATPEEFHLAEQLKELTGSTAATIDNARKKISGMPHAEKELNPLWSLLTEPLGQIIAAVGLLLSGVLGLVGKLLSGLGLGGLLDNLLGGLGIKGILNGLGLKSVTKSLTGKK